MKKLLAIIMCLVLVFSFAACGENANTNTDTDTEVKTEETSYEFESFLDEYEEWVDEYIELYNKYKANPTDTALITEYTELAGEVATWADKADEVKAELEGDPDALKEYTERLAKIATKLSGIK